MMEIDFLPEHLIIVGGSYIGLEFAQMYRRFGSHVTIIESGARPIAREDEEISAAIQAILQGEGINIRLNAQCLSVAKHGKGITVNLSCAEVSKKSNRLTSAARAGTGAQHRRLGAGSGQYQNRRTWIHRGG